MMCHRMEEGGRDVNAESSRAWGNPFFSSPAATPYCRLSKEPPYCLHTVRAALASTHSRGFGCTRRAVHRWIRVGSKDTGDKKTDDSPFRYAKLHRGSILLRQRRGRRGAASVQKRSTYSVPTPRHAIHTSAELECGSSYAQNSPRTFIISGGGVAQTVKDFRTDGTEHLGDGISSSMQKSCMMGIFKQLFIS